MIKRYRELQAKTETAREIFKDAMMANYPVVIDIRAYNANNISLTTEYHTADIYASQDREDYKVVLVCDNQATDDIPTDEEALAHVKDMRADKTAINLLLDEVSEWFRY